MALSAGTRLGVYEVVSSLGEGGMGEVYRAKDSLLKREVALKVLPSALAGDLDRLSRFQREAELLAALNHPNIAHIYGVAEAGDVRGLVMELVEGPTLAERITRGAIPPAEAAGGLTIPGGGFPAGRGAAARPPTGRGAGVRTRARHRPPRPQTGQHQGHRRRGGEGARLWAGESTRPGRPR
jgi:hypothetical protein